MRLPITRHAVLLRGRGQEQHPNHSIREPLLDQPRHDQNSQDGSTTTDDSRTPKKKVMIRIKSGSSTDYSSDDEDESVVLNDDPMTCIQNDACLSPVKPWAKAFIWTTYFVDFAVGAYLTTRSFKHYMDDLDYGHFLVCLTSGLLLLGGSLAGMVLHTPLGWVIYGSDAIRDKSLTVFNTSFAFIAVGIYYMMGLSLLVTPLFSESFQDASSRDINLQGILSVLAFSQSMLEGYRILFIAYHYQSVEISSVGPNVGSPATV